MPTSDTEFLWTITDASGDEVDVPLYVEFEYEPYIPAQTYGPPESCYPAEGGGCSIITCVRTDTDEPVVLDDKSLADLEEYLVEHCLPEDDGDYYDY